MFNSTIKCTSQNKINTLYIFQNLEDGFIEGIYIDFNNIQKKLLIDKDFTHIGTAYENDKKGIVLGAWSDEYYIFPDAIEYINVSSIDKQIDNFIKLI